MAETQTAAPVEVILNDHPGPAEVDAVETGKQEESSSKREESHQKISTSYATSSSSSSSAAATASRHEEHRDADLSTSGGSSAVREAILTHPMVLKNRTEGGIATSHISTESRYVMRKGFDLGFTSSSSSSLRVMYDTRIKELEEELDTERSGRSKAEKQRADLEREVSLLTEQLDETTQASKLQVETIKKRDAEFLKQQKDLEEVQTQHELQLASFRKKHQEQINQLSEQLDQQHKAKQKNEREKNQTRAEADELRLQIEILTQGKASSDKSVKHLESQVGELGRKISDLERELANVQGQRNRVQSENTEFSRRIQDSGNQVQLLEKAKLAIDQQVEELKASLDIETAARAKIVGDNRALQQQISQLKEHLDEEEVRRSELQRQLSNATSEAALWRQKYESGEGNIRPEEVEELKKKFVLRVQEAEAQLESAVGKVVALEKVKAKSQQDIEALLVEVEKLKSANDQNEKRQRQFDKLIDEWKHKVIDLQAQLEVLQKESRANATESYKYKAQIEETNAVVDGLRRENKNLSEEIHELSDQLNHARSRALEIEKVSKRFEAERHELHGTLEEAEAALEQEEAKAQRAQVELSLAREETERRLAEKEEEFESIRKNHQRAIETVQASLEAEGRNKVDALRVKKKLEQDINDLELALDALSKSKGDVERTNKKYQQQIRELQQMVDEEHRLRHTAREELVASERRATLLAGELEDMKSQLEVLDKNRKVQEGEVTEAVERISELSAANSALNVSKKKLESDIQTIRVEYEDQSHALKAAEDQARKAVADAARVADELHQEQDHSNQLDKLRRTLETQLKELQQRLDEAEAAALLGDKKTIQKLELRIKELETELNGEQNRQTEKEKTVRKQERRLQEITLQVEEDRKVQDRMHDMIDKLQQKIKNYKRQVEEAEEIAAINLAKYRKIQHDLEETEARADIAERTVQELRTRNRSSMSITESVSQQQPYSGVTMKTTTRTQTISKESSSRSSDSKGAIEGSAPF